MNSKVKCLFVFGEFVWFPFWVFSTDRKSLTISLVSAYSNNAQKREWNKLKTKQNGAIVLSEVDRYIRLYWIFFLHNSSCINHIVYFESIGWCLPILIHTRLLIHNQTIRPLHKKRDVHVKLNSMQRRLLSVLPLLFESETNLPSYLCCSFHIFFFCSSRNCLIALL